MVVGFAILGVDHRYAGVEDVLVVYVTQAERGIWRWVPLDREGFSLFAGIELDCCIRDFLLVCMVGS